ncbi:hypothetical protein FAM18113_01651 [Lacticaseibacillus paracasei]|nr:hypothetical protein FAM18113_01651 [Lacticaseibacillus paracasei]
MDKSYLLSKILLKNLYHIYQDYKKHVFDRDV